MNQQPCTAYLKPRMMTRTRLSQSEGLRQALKSLIMGHVVLQLRVPSLQGIPGVQVSGMFA